MKKNNFTKSFNDTFPRFRNKWTRHQMLCSGVSLSYLTNFRFLVGEFNLVQLFVAIYVRVRIVDLTEILG